MHKSNGKDILAVSAFPRPFDARRVDLEVEFGATVSDIVGIAFPDPALHQRIEVFIGDRRVDPKFWPYVRPKPGAVISVNIVPGDGGALRIALTVVVVIAAIIATFFAPYGTPAYWAAVGVTVAGSVALALLPPPVPQINDTDNSSGSTTYSLSQSRNVFKPNGTVPQLFGNFRFAAPKAAEYVEVSGGHTYLRTLLILSTGLTTDPIITIGETAIDQFTGVETEFKRGWHPDLLTEKGGWDATSGSFPASPDFGDRWVVTAAGVVGGTSFAIDDSLIRNHAGDGTTSDGWDRNHDKPSEIVPSDVHTEGFNVPLLYNSSIIRTSQIKADELAVTISFSGLIQYRTKGGKQTAEVSFKIEYSPTGAGTWTNVGTFKVRGRQTTALFWSKRWPVNRDDDPNGQFDIRVTRKTVENPTSDNQFIADSYLSRIDTFTHENPLGANVGFTTLALRIRASGQLAGTLDTLQTECQSIERDWDSGSGSWVWRPTSRPAAHFRHVLQQPARPSGALADTRIDLDRLADWSESDETAGRTFDAYIDFATNEYKILEDIAASGFASLTIRGTKYAVFVDEPKTTPVRLFSPRNTSKYDGKTYFPQDIHAYRISFINSEKNFIVDEVVAYADGYDALNARNIEAREYLGLTTKDANWLRGRRDLAEARLRRESHTFNTALLSVCCEQGDLVSLQHDAISVGLASGRIKAVA